MRISHLHLHVHLNNWPTRVSANLIYVDGRALLRPPFEPKLRPPIEPKLDDCGKRSLGAFPSTRRLSANGRI